MDQQKTATNASGFLMELQRPIFPARLQASIFGDELLNFRVRDGNGWTNSPKPQQWQRLRALRGVIWGVQVQWRYAFLLTYA